MHTYIGILAKTIARVRTTDIFPARRHVGRMWFLFEINSFMGFYCKALQREINGEEEIGSDAGKGELEPIESKRIGLVWIGHDRQKFPHWSLFWTLTHAWGCFLSVCTYARVTLSAARIEFYAYFRSSDQRLHAINLKDAYVRAFEALLNCKCLPCDYSIKFESKNTIDGSWYISLDVLSAQKLSYMGNDSVGAIALSKVLKRGEAIRRRRRNGKEREGGLKIIVKARGSTSAAVCLSLPVYIYIYILPFSIFIPLVTNYMPE